MRKGKGKYVSAGVALSTSSRPQQCKGHLAISCISFEDNSETQSHSFQFLLKLNSAFSKKKLNSAGSWAKTSRSSQRPCHGAESPPHSRRGRTHGVAFRPCHGRRLSSSSMNNGAPPLAVGTPMSERSLSQAPRSSSRLWL